jgi:hypothetical protein
LDGFAWSWSKQAGMVKHQDHFFVKNHIVQALALSWSCNDFGLISLQESWWQSQGKCSISFVYKTLMINKVERAFCTPKGKRTSG